MNRNTNDHDEPAAPGLSDHLGALVSASRAWITDSIGLILLDGQLAGVSLVRMLIYGLIAFVMFITGWLALMLAASFFLHRLGLPIELVILSIAIATIALGVFLVFRITALSANITFQTSRHHFSSRESASGSGSDVTATAIGRANGAVTSTDSAGSTST